MTHALTATAAAAGALDTVNAPQSAVIETPTKVENVKLTPSAFLVREVARFTRSQTALYVTLILDVIQAHGGKRPAGYVDMLCEMAPTIGRDNWKQYCTIIDPALRHPVYSAKLATYPATVPGVDAATTWIEETARAGGYTLALRDLVAFLKGGISAKARAKAEEEERAKNLKLAMLAKQDEKGDVSQIAKAGQAFMQGEAVARTDAAIPAHADKLATDAASNDKRKADQEEAEANNPVVRLVSDIQPLDRGPAIDGGFHTVELYVHTCDTTGLVTVRGAQNLTESAMVATIEALQMQLDAMRAAVADTVAS